MKFFKHYNLFEASRSGNWSLSGHLISSLASNFFNKLSMINRSYNIKKIAEEYDEYLNTVYKKYLLDRTIEFESKNKIIDNKPTAGTISKYNINDEVDSEPISKPVDVNSDKVENGTNSVVEIPNTQIIPKEIINKQIEKPIVKLKDIIDFNKHPILGYEPKIKELIENSDSTKVDSIIKEIEKRVVAKFTEREKSKKNTKQFNDANKYIGFLDDLKTDLTNIHVKESIDWSGNAIIPPSEPIKWSDEDKRNITNLVNSYKIDEFTLRVKEYVDGVDDSKKTKQLENEWSKLLNSINRKWFYVYDINRLNDKNKSISSKKEEKNINIKNFKVSELIRLSFKDNKEVYKYSDLKSNMKGFFILPDLIQNNLILLYRLNDSYLFKVLGVLTYDINKSDIKDTIENSNIKWSVDTSFIYSTPIVIPFKGKDAKKLFMDKTLGIDFPILQLTNNDNITSWNSYYKKDKELKTVVLPLDTYYGRMIYLNVDINDNVFNLKPTNELNQEIKKINQ